jgi:apolipoprotein N-acyltransferase
MISEQTQTLRLWQKCALAALSGLLLVGAYPSLDWGWLAWVGLVPLLATFPHRRLRDAVVVGLVFGLIYCGGVSSWVAVFAGHIIGRSLGIVVWLIATITQTATPLAVTLGAYALTRHPSRWAWRLGVPAVWTLGEWLRQFGPFGTGWGDLAYTQHAALTILQTTKLAGVFGLSFLIVLVNVALCELFICFVAIQQRRPSPSPAFPFAVGLVVIAALLYGRVTIATEHLRPNFIAAALQANVDENVHWSPAYSAQTMAAFGQEAQQASSQGASLVVWPETAFPGYLASDPVLRSQAQMMAIQNHEAMLVGSVDYDFQRRQNFNALFLVKADGTLSGSYRKQQLVPFGEYVPFRRWMPFLTRLHLTFRDMEPGGPNQTLMDDGPPVGKIGVAICYESSNGEIMRRQVARGANLLVVSTDDTWFGRTAAPAQHADIAAIRAAENDRYLVRSAATGISEIFTPTGQVIAHAGLFQRRVVLAPVQSRHDLTPYTRYADWFVALCGLGLAWCVVPWARMVGSKRRV